MESDSLLCRAFCKALGLAVRHARQQRAWSQEQMAAEAGLNRTYVGQIERGDVCPSVWTLVKLCNALGTSPDLLLKLR